jgi:hypothetical protein
MKKVNESIVTGISYINLRKLLRIRFHSLLLLFTFLLFTFSLPIFAQETSQEIAPPPLKIMPKGEKEQLEAKTDIKERTKLALMLMDARLKKAEELDTQDKFHEMYDELGKFHAVMDYTYNFLYRNGNGSSKVLSNFKRFEIGIRAYVPRIEVVRRNLPIKYESYLRNLIKQIRDTREKTVDAFFDDSVVPQAKNNLKLQ